jgi:hypothetical protein
VSTYRVLLTAVSVQSAKPSYHYGVLPAVPIKDGAAYMLVRAGVSLPRNAVITSAKIWVNQYDSISGGLTLSVRRNFTAWPKGVTWSTKPAVTDTTHTRNLSSAFALWWDIDVTADVQGFVAGTKANYGWRIMSNSSFAHKWLGSSAARRQPYLEITYVIPPKVPTGLSPQGGAVTVDKPVLTFAVGSDTLSVQVQVDAAADSVSPDFDSGEIVATAGVVDLAETAYAGLADGSTTYWRARAKNSYGWSAWSAWVDFSRNDLDAVTITDPTATPADGSPPFVWSFAGTQTAWQATLLDALGVVLDDSGVVAGTDTDWTPTKGLAENGDQGTARVRVWDDVTRIATSGQPAYSEASVNFTVTFDGTVDPMDTLVAAQVAGSPGVVLTGTRAAKRGGGSAPLPLDEEIAEARYQRESAEHVTAEQLFEQRWAQALLAEVMNRLRQEMEQAGKLRQFEALKFSLTGEKTAYADVARTLGMSESAVKVAVHRLRSRYRELLRLEIAETVSTPEEINDELRHLFAALSI